MLSVERKFQPLNRNQKKNIDVKNITKRDKENFYRKKKWFLSEVNI